MARKHGKPGESNVDWQVVGSNYFRFVNTDTGVVYDCILRPSENQLEFRINDVVQDGIYRTFGEVDEVVRKHTLEQREWGK